MTINIEQSREDSSSYGAPVVSRTDHLMEVDGFQHAVHFANGFTLQFDAQANHRLVHRDRKTAWAPYTGWTYLDGMVGYTSYFAKTEGICTLEEFAKLAAVGLKSE